MYSIVSQLSQQYRNSTSNYCNTIAIVLPTIAILSQQYFQLSQYYRNSQNLLNSHHYCWHIVCQKYWVLANFVARTSVNSWRHFGYTYCDITSLQGFRRFDTVNYSFIEICQVDLLLLSLASRTTKNPNKRNKIFISNTVCCSALLLTVI